MKRALVQVARQPLVHFAVLGGLLFAAHAVVSGDKASADSRHVTLTEAQLADLDPGRVDQLVAEEVLYREAMSIGLDRGDPVVRRRLVQKMEFLLEGVQTEPTDVELQAYLDAHAGAFRLAATATFEHVYFSRDEHADAADRAAAFAASPGADPSTAGDPFPAGRSFTARTRVNVAGRFGEAFADAVFTAPIGSWHGPVDSELGAHAIRVSEREPERAATVDAVRPTLKAEYVRARRADVRRDAIDELVRSYRVDLSDRGAASK